MNESGMSTFGSSQEVESVASQDIEHLEEVNVHKKPKEESIPACATNDDGDHFANGEPNQVSQPNRSNDMLTEDVPSSIPEQSTNESGEQIGSDNSSRPGERDDEMGNEQHRPAGGAPPPPQVGVGSNRQRHHRLTIRDRHGVFMNYLFLNLTLRYVMYFKSTARRLIEFFSLLNAMLMLLLLFYIHIAFVRKSGNCLNHVKDIWPQGGILRVQISNNASDPAYQLLFVKDNIPSSISFQSTPYSSVFKFYSPILPKYIVDYTDWKRLVLNSSENAFSHDDSQKMCRNENILDVYRDFYLLKTQCPLLKQDYMNKLKISLSSMIESIVAEMSVEYRYSDDVQKFLASTTQTMKTSPQNVFSEIMEYDPFNPPLVRQYYAIEYSKEFGYLRLSPNARYKLGIPTLLVNLNPDTDECFGNGLKRFMLKTFLGYDDFLMSSIKNLAEGDKSQGYLRNCVTGEYFRFVAVWVNHVSGFIAFLVMIVFTLIVSILLRYSYHQIFMFMMEVLRLFDADIRLVFPAAPMLTIVLALVGMEEIMTEFFHDSTVAFYVILLIWTADQFDVICLHTVVGRRVWVRFFFLYHFAFYIYNYKFNGQYSKLALFTSWLFTFHSMLYFLHHFEIPAIQRQMAIITQRQRRNNGSGAAEQDDSTQPGGDSSEPAGDDDVLSAAASSFPSDNTGANQPTNDDESTPDTVAAFLDTRLNMVRCYLRTLCVSYLPHLCSFAFIISAVFIAAAIYSKLTWSNQTLDIMPVVQY